MPNIRITQYEENDFEFTINGMEWQDVLNLLSAYDTPEETVATITQVMENEGEIVFGVEWDDAPIPSDDGAFVSV